MTGLAITAMRDDMYLQGRWGKGAAAERSALDRVPTLHLRPRTMRHAGSVPVPRSTFAQSAAAARVLPDQPQLAGVERNTTTLGRGGDRPGALVANAPPVQSSHSGQPPWHAFPGLL